MDIIKSSSCTEIPRSEGERYRSRSWFTMKVSRREVTWSRIRNFAPSADAERRDW